MGVEGVDDLLRLVLLLYRGMAVCWLLVVAIFWRKAKWVQWWGAGFLSGSLVVLGVSLSLLCLARIALTLSPLLFVISVRLGKRHGSMIHRALCFGFSTVEISRESGRFIFLLPGDEAHLSERMPTGPGQSRNLDELHAI